MSDQPQSEQPEAGAAQGLDLGISQEQTPNDSGAATSESDASQAETENAAAASSLAATDPESLPIPADHPLAFLGGPFRYLVAHIVELEARLKKLEGG